MDPGIKALKGLENLGTPQKSKKLLPTIGGLGFLEKPLKISWRQFLRFGALGFWTRRLGISRRLHVFRASKIQLLGYLFALFLCWTRAALNVFHCLAHCWSHMDLSWNTARLQWAGFSRFIRDCEKGSSFKDSSLRYQWSCECRLTRLARLYNSLHPPTIDINDPKANFQEKCFTTSKAFDFPMDTAEGCGGLLFTED